MADETTTTPAPAAPAAPEAPAPAPGGFFDPPAADTQESTETAPAAELTPEPPAAETPPVAAAKPEEKPEPKLAALMQKEAELRKQREEVKAAEERIKAFEAKKKKALEDPLEVLTELGLTYEQITDFVLNGKKATPEMLEAARIAKIEEQLGAIAADKAQQEAARRQATVSAFKDSIRSYVAADLDKFEYIQAQDAHELVFDVINAHYDNHGELLGGTTEKAIALAAEQVEKYLEDKTERLLTTKKLKSKVSPVTPPSAPETAQRPQVSSSARQTVSPSRPTTLTNSQAAAVPPRAPKKFTSVEDSIAETLASGIRLFDE